MNRLFLLGFLWAFLLLSCDHNPNEQLVTSFEGTAMTINYRVIIGTSLQKKEETLVKQIINETFREVDTIYNKWNPKSELSLLNNLQAKEKVALSEKLMRLLIITDRIVKLTEGKFDPTIEPLQKIWRTALEASKTPSLEALKPILLSVGWDNIHFSEGVFWKDHSLTSLDLSGIAKGYAIDLLVEGLKKIGLDNIYVEWGGEVRTFGSHPEGRPWRVFISRLGDQRPEKALALVELHDQALATSGDYLQNWTVRRPGTDSFMHYTHIFDPKTKAPLEMTRQSIASASVLANSCAEADGLATAAMCFDNMEGASLWAENLKKQYPELEFWIVSRELE